MVGSATEAGWLKHLIGSEFVDCQDFGEHSVLNSIKYQQIISFSGVAGGVKTRGKLESCHAD